MKQNMKICKFIIWSHGASYLEHIVHCCQLQFLLDKHKQQIDLVESQWQHNVDQIDKGC